MKKFIRFILLVLLLLPASLITQEQTKGLNWYMDEATTAIEKENFEYAVKILKEGITLFPAVAPLNIQLADLYYEKELYKPALKEYLAADKKEPDIYSTLDQIQICYGYLNEDETSIHYLERMLTLYPTSKNADSKYAVHDLSWMYYKTHKLSAGETLILEHLKQAPADESKRSLYMTLGTIYSGMYEYEKSKRYYTDAIKEAVDDKDKNFAAICYYNLALMEYTFYNFNSALKYTNEALKQYNRATGHLAKGELLQLQMNYKEALAEYEMGLQKEETPLTTINMANLFQKFGLLDSAKLYAEKAFSSADLSWTLNFGTDKDQHKTEMHKLLADIYEGLWKREKLLPQPHIIAQLQSFLRSVWYGLNTYYHRQLFKTYSIKIGKANLKEQNLIDAFWQFYQGNAAYKEIALKYLNKARELETAVAPNAVPYYIQQEGNIRKSEMLIRESLTYFDTYWEKESIFDSLIMLLPLLKRGSAEWMDTLNQAYAINPGGVFAAGYGIPLELELNLTGSISKLKNVIVSNLKKAG